MIIRRWWPQRPSAAALNFCRHYGEVTTGRSVSIAPSARFRRWPPTIMSAARGNWESVPHRFAIQRNDLLFGIAASLPIPENGDDASTAPMRLLRCAIFAVEQQLPLWVSRINHSLQWRQASDPAAQNLATSMRQYHRGYSGVDKRLSRNRGNGQT